jgi:hypothetical protein
LRSLPGSTSYNVGLDHVDTGKGKKTAVGMISLVSVLTTITSSFARVRLTVDLSEV